MLRSAAKNHKYVGVVTCPSQYSQVLAELEQGALSFPFRRKLAAAAFEMTARYDRAIADYMSGLCNSEEASDPEFPSVLSLQFERRSSLRYGENPHQRAAFYVEKNPPSSTLAAANTLHGKELSYNNLLDLDAAMQIVREFRRPAACVIKHNNPCGCAVSDALVEAYVMADGGDPVSAFGSILGFNRPVDTETADQLCVPGRFIEAIIAPSYEPAAFEMLTTVPKWKANVRLLECPALLDPRPISQEYRRVTGGLLIQDRDESAEDMSQWKVVTTRGPSASEFADLEFAWLVCKHVKSNAIVYANAGQTISVGAGQMSRFDSSRIAALKAQEAGIDLKGTAAASDAFFPFADGLLEAVKAGATAVIQPGGSVRDQEVIAAADAHDIAMLFTGIRHFRH